MSQEKYLRSVYKVGSITAFLAAISVLIANVAFMAAGPPVEGVEQTIKQINDSTLIIAVAFGAVWVISLFDIFTVPGLYFAVREGQHTFALSGAILAVVGDILGLTSGVIQSALLRLSASYTAASGAERAAVVTIAKAVDELESVFFTSGFLLVGASFIFFGVAMLKGGFSKWIGWIGIAAGVASIVGQIPSLSLAFLVANLLYLAWYIGIGARFRTLATFGSTNQ